LKSWIGKRVATNGAKAATAAPARLLFDHVSRHYGPSIALDDVSLDVLPGSVTCLLGPSGCGKTTLLRIAAGVERPSSGRVWLNGVELVGPAAFVPPEARGVGLMFQDFALFPHLTIAQNVAFGLRGQTREAAAQTTAAMLDRVGLAHYADAYPHILSGGQQQRVALARAIAPRPSVLLMDEPFSGLDVQLRESMQDQTLALLRETGATAIIVTHHPEEAMRLGDRIGVMRAGRLEQVGSAEELYATPGGLFVARLFSEINELAYTSRGGAVDTPIGRLPVGSVPDGATVVVGVRERAIGVSLCNGSGNGIHGRVIDLKFLGDATLVEIAADGFAAPLRARTHAGERFEKGAEVALTIDPSRLLIFPGVDQEGH
jgi:iron(III) transport system ATP-binding protein